MNNLCSAQIDPPCPLTNLELTAVSEAMKELFWPLRVIEAMPSGVTLVDLRQPDFPLVYVNPTFLAMTGYELHEVIGQNCRFLQNDDCEQSELNTIRVALSEKRATSVLLRNYRKDGTMFWNRLHLAPVRDQTGEITHFVGVQQDVTREIQAIEEMRQAKEEAEQANQIKADFLSLMSHELRTPMNAILGFSQLLEQDPLLGDAQRENVTEILYAGQRLLRLINEVLFLSQLTAGQNDLICELFSVNSLAVDCLARVMGLAQTHGVHLKNLINPEFTLWADRSAMRQVLLNLLSNAIRFNHKNGRVELRATWIEQKPTWLRLEVMDTGPGIPQEYIHDLLLPFKALHPDPLCETGYGIGLAVCRQLIDDMGGRIGVTSQVGEGSVFWIELPSKSLNLSSSINS